MVNHVKPLLLLVPSWHVTVSTSLTQRIKLRTSVLEKLCHIYFDSVGAFVVRMQVNRYRYRYTKHDWIFSDFSRCHCHYPAISFVSSGTRKPQPSIISRPSRTRESPTAGFYPPFCGRRDSIINRLWKIKASAINDAPGCTTLNSIWAAT